jgi:hypothetical protein
MSHAHVKGRACVNLALGGPSYITVTSADNDFTSATLVETVQDTDHGFEWLPDIVKQKAGEMRIRLIPKPPPPPAAGEFSVEDSPPPDSGNLTVTITAPVKTVDAGTVDYVNDPPPPPPGP